MSNTVNTIQDCLHIRSANIFIKQIERGKDGHNHNDRPQEDDTNFPN